MTGKTTTKKGSINYSLRALVPILFDPKTDPDKDSSKLEQKTIEIPMDPNDEESDFIKQKYWVLREPHEDPETFAKWHVQVHELIAAKKATTSASQLAVAKALLAGPALELFQAATLAVDAENTNLPPRPRWTDKQWLVKIFAHMARNVYHMDNAYIRQRTYLLYNTRMGEKFRVREYVCWLKQLNNYLPMLPVEDGTPAVKLTEAQLRAIVERACPKVGTNICWCTILTSTTKRWTRLSLTLNASRPWTTSSVQRRTTTHLWTPNPRNPRKALEATRGLNVTRTTIPAENGARSAKRALTTQRIAGPRTRPVATTKRATNASTSAVRKTVPTVRRVILCFPRSNFMPSASRLQALLERQTTRNARSRRLPTRKRTTSQC